MDKTPGKHAEFFLNFGETLEEYVEENQENPDILIFVALELGYPNLEEIVKA